MAATIENTGHCIKAPVSAASPNLLEVQSHSVYNLQVKSCLPTASFFPHLLAVMPCAAMWIYPPQAYGPL